MAISPHVLIYGREVTLLDTRALILQKAGFGVSATQEFAVAERIIETQPVNVFILCYTLSLHEREEALELARSLRPDMKNLVLEGPGLMPPAARRDEIFSTFDGPAALLAAINRLLGREFYSESSPAEREAL